MKQTRMRTSVALIALLAVVIGTTGNGLAQIEWTSLEDDTYVKTSTASAEMQRRYGVVDYEVEYAPRGLLPKMLVARDRDGELVMKVESGLGRLDTGHMKITTGTGEEFEFTYATEESGLGRLSVSANGEHAALELLYDPAVGDVTDVLYERADNSRLYQAVGTAFALISDHHPDMPEVEPEYDEQAAVFNPISFCIGACIMCAAGSVPACKVCAACGLAGWICYELHCAQDPNYCHPLYPPDGSDPLYNPGPNPQPLPGDPSPEYMPWMPPPIPGGDITPYVECATEPTRFH